MYRQRGKEMNQEGWSVVIVAASVASALASFAGESVVSILLVAVGVIALSQRPNLVSTAVAAVAFLLPPLIDHPILTSSVMLVVFAGIAFVYTFTDQDNEEANL